MDILFTPYCIVFCVEANFTFSQKRISSYVSQIQIARHRVNYTAARSLTELSDYALRWISQPNRFNGIAMQDNFGAIRFGIHHDHGQLG